MKKKSISDSELRLILILLALVIFVCAYFLGYDSLSSSASLIEKENRENQLKVTRLETMVRGQERIEEEIKENNEKINQVIEQFPSNVTVESAIVFLQELEDETGIEFSSASFVPVNVINEQVGNYSIDSTMFSVVNGGYYLSMELNYEVSYEELKSVFAYLKNYDDRVNIINMSMTYDDETSLLNGSMSIHMYYLTNTGRPYEVPDIKGIPLGVDNIFSAGNVKKNSR